MCFFHTISNKTPYEMVKIVKNSHFPPEKVHILEIILRKKENNIFIK